MSQTSTGSSSASAVTELFGRSDSQAERREYGAGSVIHEQHAPAEDVHLIHEGQVRIYQVGANDNMRLVEILGPGEWFGAASLAETQRHESRAVAMTSAVISKMPADRLMAAIAQTPAADQLIRQLATRWQREREDGARLVFDDCNQRLVKVMLRFSDSAAAVQNGDSVELHITHDQLAQAIGVARETVSLALTEMRHRNIVRTGRNRVIFDRDALKRIADNGSTQAAV